MYCRYIEPARGANIRRADVEEPSDPNVRLGLHIALQYVDAHTFAERFSRLKEACDVLSTWEGMSFERRLLLIPIDHVNSRQVRERLAAKAQMDRVPEVESIDNVVDQYQSLVLPIRQLVPYSATSFSCKN